MTLADGSKEFRYRVHDGELNLDETLSATGFAGDVDVDWQNIAVITAGGNMEFRVGVRDGNWVIDETLTATGFAGAEGVHWINIEQHS
jgi:hypothetical protein